MVMEFFEKLPRWVIVTSGVFLIGVIGAVDYLTGDYSVLVFYALPIFLVTWFARLWPGIALCFLAGVARFSADLSLTESGSHHIWNAVQDMMFLLIVAVLIAFLHRALE
ncbi:hypothetical protein [Geomobilimonas luticola]|uniref:Uncharacterized protein n=1 Tax=Geomobilimonas luticola TaxID=1114878 RepID=A0ABS5SG15_9BACT|nr:hypothetical protein [Geomobilimonas luticola]MBT0654306.1 hypothetical protein [Geomobilimonas luticola]